MRDPHKLDSLHNLGGLGFLFVPDSRRSLQPASLKWQEDGELSAQDTFNLICRLRAVEPGATSNELWRLGQKYPTSASGHPQAGGTHASGRTRARSHNLEDINNRSGSDPLVDLIGILLPALDLLTLDSSVVFATEKQIPVDSVEVFTFFVMSSTQDLTIGQQFEVERFSRAIDATADPAQLKALAKQLLQAWHTQKAATEWVKSQQLGRPPGSQQSQTVAIAGAYEGFIRSIVTEQPSVDRAYKFLSQREQGHDRRRMALEPLRIDQADRVAVHAIASLLDPHSLSRPTLLWNRSHGDD